MRSSGLDSRLDTWGSHPPLANIADPPWQRSQRAQPNLCAHPARPGLTRLGCLSTSGTQRDQPSARRLQTPSCTMTVAAPRVEPAQEPDGGLDKLADCCSVVLEQVPDGAG